MKKILIALMALGMMACTGKIDTAGKSSQETPQAQQAPEPGQEQAADEAASAQDTDDHFVTTDLAALEVTGHVRTILSQAPMEVSYTFDRRGRLVHVSNIAHYTSSVTRDDDGNLTLGVAESVETFTVDNAHKRLALVEGWGEGASEWTKNYVYNASGELTHIKWALKEIWDGEERTAQKTMKVQVTRRDPHGNWTERKVDGETESRKITYYAPGGSSAADGANPLKGEHTFTGKIGGDDNALLSLTDGAGSYTVINAARSAKVDKFDAATGRLIVKAMELNTQKHIGAFDGTFKNGRYKGVFTNTKGGKVDFDLRLR